MAKSIKEKDFTTKSIQVEPLIQEKLQEENAELLSVTDSFYGMTPDNKVVLIVICEVKAPSGIVTAAKFMISLE